MTTITLKVNHTAVQLERTNTGFVISKLMNFADAPYEVTREELQAMIAGWSETGIYNPELKLTIVDGELTAQGPSFTQVVSANVLTALANMIYNWAMSVKFAIKHTLVSPQPESVLLTLEKVFSVAEGIREKIEKEEVISELASRYETIKPFRLIPLLTQKQIIITAHKHNATLPGEVSKEYLLHLNSFIGFEMAILNDKLNSTVTQEIERISQFLVAAYEDSAYDLVMELKAKLKRVNDLENAFTALFGDHYSSVMKMVGCDEYDRVRTKGVEVNNPAMGAILKKVHQQTTGEPLNVVLSEEVIEEDELISVQEYVYSLTKSFPSFTERFLSHTQEQNEIKKNRYFNVCSSIIRPIVGILNKAGYTNDLSTVEPCISANDVRLEDYSYLAVKIVGKKYAIVPRLFIQEGLITEVSTFFNRLNNKS